MTEKHLAERWQVSLKTLRRWRLDGEGSVWHKLFRWRSPQASAGSPNGTREPARSGRKKPN